MRVSTLCEKDVSGHSELEEAGLKAKIRAKREGRSH